MSTAIRVENLGKRYQLHLGRPGNGYRTLRESLVDLAKAPIRRLRSGAPVETEEFWALRDIDFEVPVGEAVGIIGRNGAGKSTLLKILSRITKPTTGRVALHGRVGSLLEVGTGFHPELTGRENIYLNGSILGMTRREITRRFDEIVAFAEVEKFLDTPVKRYSSGMYVRLAFAVAAHLEPEILVVDEVLAVGDAAFQKKCMSKMHDFAGCGRTVLFVSHNLASVHRLCTRGVFLNRGRIEYSGPSEEAVAHYLESTGIGDAEGYRELDDHPGRPSGMIPIIRSFGLLANESPAHYRTSFATGESVRFEIEFDCGNLRIDWVLIGICNPLGERICTTTTMHSPDFSKSLTGRGVLECMMPGLPLAEGEYNITVVMGTRLPHQNIDVVENAIGFKVETGDYFGTGVPLLRGQGILAQRSQWSITG